MAKSLRSSTRKANNAQLKKSVFGPIEAARADRLSAKLLELAAQPKPKAPEKDAEMEEARTEDGAGTSLGAETGFRGWLTDRNVRSSTSNEHRGRGGGGQPRRSAFPPSLSLSLSLSHSLSLPTLKPPAGYRKLISKAAMDLDATTKPAPSKKGRGNKRIEKRRTKKKSSVVFPSFKDRTSAKKRR